MARISALTFVLFATLAFVHSVSAAPASLASRVVKRSTTGVAAPDSYIVVLKDHVSKRAHFTLLKQFLSTSKSSFNILYDNEYNGVLNGYSAVLKEPLLAYLLADATVDYIEEDAVVQLNNLNGTSVPNAEVTKIQSRATRGGAGVNIYGIDTGILTTHTAFGGRAYWGKTFGGYKDADGNGHGTHTAGTAVGKGYGVATAAHIIAVKVLDDQGSGKISDIIAGIKYAVSSSYYSGKPSIVIMSLGSNISQSMDDAVKAAIKRGLHFAIAAGNDNIDAKDVSPARVAPANTIGAVDSSHNKAFFSNFGEVIDCWAPGVDIQSAFIGSNTATATFSGTSMAAPFVAGILAQAISSYGNKSPELLSQDLATHSVNNAQDVPPGTTSVPFT